jgi:hypothetical protein
MLSLLIIFTPKPDSIVLFFSIPANFVGNGRERKPYVLAAEYSARLWPNQTQGEVQVAARGTGTGPK